ncbi:hypothetical protein KY338_01980 [Candidatus Woesearchaeota archaeon]|nr:hypothetical protein [Candidatus Woesearchaeota archaeon]MBW3005954.1 hypothetical protein [Candidatus Woesearchaeota archaeon]
MADKNQKKDELEVRVKLSGRELRLRKIGLIDPVRHKEEVAAYLSENGLALPEKRIIKRPKNVPNMTTIRSLADRTVVMQYEFNRSLKWVHNNTSLNRVKEFFLQKVLGKKLMNPDEVIDAQLQNMSDINAIYKDFVDYSMHLLHNHHSLMLDRLDERGYNRAMLIEAIKAWKEISEKHKTARKRLAEEKKNNSFDKVLADAVNENQPMSEYGPRILRVTNAEKAMLRANHDEQESRRIINLVYRQEQYLNTEMRFMLDLYQLSFFIDAHRIAALQQSQNVTRTIEQTKDLVHNLVQGGNYDAALLEQHVGLNKSVKYLYGFVSSVMDNVVALHNSGYLQLPSTDKTHIFGGLKSGFRNYLLEDAVLEDLEEPGILIDRMAIALPSEIEVVEDDS